MAGERQFEEWAHELYEWCLARKVELAPRIGVDEVVDGIEFFERPREIVVELIQRMDRIGLGIGDINPQEYRSARTAADLLKKIALSLDPASLPATVAHACGMNDSRRAAAASVPVHAVRLGDRRYQVDDNAPFILGEVEDTVVVALIELGGAASKDQLAERSGIRDAPQILKRIVEKHPSLQPFITRPGGKGQGGYRTAIKFAAR